MNDNLEFGSSQRASQENLQGISGENVGIVDLSRRTFLKQAALLVATLAVGCDKEKTGSKNGKDPKAKDSSPEKVEYDKYALPKVEFKSSTSFDEPQLPTGFDKKNLPVLRKKFVSELEKHFSAYKEKEDGAKEAYNGLFMKLLDIIQALAPEFQNYLSELQRTCRGQADCLIDYVNKFLIPEGRLLYLGGGNPYPKANLYKVRESKDIFINDINEGRIHSVGDAMVKDENSSDVISQVMGENGSSVIIWPDIIAKKQDNFISKLNVIDSKRKQKIRGELDRGTRFHESIHIHLFRRFPEMVSNTFDIKQVYQLAEGVSISVGGAMRYDSVHELCAIGAELQTATDPTIMLGYVSENKPVNPSYQFAMHLLFLSTIKHLPADNEFKKNMEAAIKDNPNNLGEIFENNKMAKFYKENADLKTLNDVGKEMYKFGIDNMEKLHAQSKSVKARGLQDRGSMMR